MKNPKVIFLVVAVVAFLGLGTYLFFQIFFQSGFMAKRDVVVTPKEEMSLKSSNTMMKKNDSPVDDKKMTGDKMAGSRYVEYSRLRLDSSSGNRRVLFFYASWCPTCKPADANFRKNISKIPEDVALIRVNYNDSETDQEEKDLAKKYGITYQHTFVQIDATGKEVTKWNGGQIDELIFNIK